MQALNLSGSLRAGYWGSSRHLDDESGLGAAALWLKAAPKLTPNTALVFEGRAANEDYTGSGKRGVVREAYFDLSLDKTDFRIGKQIIAWGRADRINPTDNLTPRDLTLLVPEVDDERLGSLALKATHHFQDLSLTGIWLPDFKPNVIPLPRLAGISFREEIPDSRRQWAVRLEQSGKGADWSVSYFDGYDLNPDIGLGRLTPTGIDLALGHHRVRVIGADAATAIGRYGLRAEAAYTRTEDSSGIDPAIKNSFFFAVVGVERTFFEYLNVNLQYFTRVVSRFRDPERINDPLLRTVALQQAIVSSQQDRVTHGASLRLANKWLNETLEAELAAVYNVTRSDYALRPKLTYAFTDHWKGTLGADFFRGPRDSFFGRLRDNSGGYFEIRYGF